MRAIQKSLRFDTQTEKLTVTEENVPVRWEAETGEQIEAGIVGVYPDFTYQVFEGYGCALTESACHLLAQMTPETRRAALGCWFGPGGMDCRFIRMHLDSCDYSLSEYQAVEDPLKDPELHTFSIARDLRCTIPVVLEAIEMAKEPVTVLLSPWSPPWQWKTAPGGRKNDDAVYGGETDSGISPGASRCGGGHLKREYYDAWARYLVKYMEAFLASGIPVGMLSVQNEANAATPWDSCVFTAQEEMSFLRESLYPALTEAGLEKKIEIFIWDHNRERMVEHVTEMMEGGIRDMVAGFAYHWYAGEHHQALDMLAQRYPGKILMRSEGCPLHKPGVAPWEEERNHAGEIDFGDAMRYAGDIIGGLNHGMQRWIEWNAIVDEQGGPRHVPGGFAAPLVALAGGGFREELSYAYLRSMAQAVHAGAVRLGITTYSRDLDAAAVRNPDGSIGLLLLSHTEGEKRIAVRFSGWICLLRTSGKGLTTVRFMEN